MEAVPFAEQTPKNNEAVFEFEETDGSKTDAKKTPDEVLHIGRANKNFPKGFMRMLTVNVSQKEKLMLDDTSAMFVVKIGGDYVIHLPLAKEGDDAEEAGLDFETIEAKRIEQWKPDEYFGYMLLLAKPVTNGFDIHLVKSEFLKAEIEAGRLVGSTGNDDEELIMKAKTTELNNFFIANLKKLYGENIMTLRRLK